MTTQCYETVADLRPQTVTAVPLSELVADYGWSLAAGTDAGGVEISGVAVDSADAVRGEMFVALPGQRVHGADFARNAVATGACAVLTDADGARRIAEQGLEIPVAITQDPRSIVGQLAARIYGDPSLHVPTVGVTGTNGKTTTTYLTHSIFERFFGTGVLTSTVELSIGDITVEAPRTTVEAPVLQRFLALGREHDAHYAAVEVSSHAVSLGRVAGTHFDCVGFTNLQQDHLDFHHTMEEYLLAKADIFRPERSRCGVVCVDDEWGQRLAELCVERGLPVLTVSTGEQPADWRATDISTVNGTRFTIIGPDGERYDAECGLPGIVNVQNSMVAMGIAVQSGIPMSSIIEGLAHARQVPGRMHKIFDRTERHGLGLVDYAHTPEALEKILTVVRELTPGRVIHVFGCDGDRFAGKRPIMGGISARLADYLVITDENPHTEDAASIREAICEGVRQERPDMHDVEVISSWRGDAVYRGAIQCGPQDTVVITGKGSEPYIEMAYTKIRYNDAPMLDQIRHQLWGDE